MAGMEVADGPYVRIAQIGHRYIKMSIGLEKIMQAPQGRQRIAHVLERMVAGDEIEFFVAKIDIRQRRGLHGDSIDPLAVAGIAEARLDAIDFESAPPRRHQKLAAAGADVEDAHAGFEQRPCRLCGGCSTNSKAISSARRSRKNSASISPAGRPSPRSGRCDLSDGKIHTDSKSKIITVLLYMNETWEQADGRLRLLRSATDLNDIIVEVPPVAGTLLAFKRSHNSWHGHESFSGERRVIQFNWLTSQGNRQSAMLRHHTSASFKRVLQMILPNR
jgi:hypothetical protein